MGQTIQSGNTSVTGSVQSVPTGVMIPSSSQTIIHQRILSNGSAQNIYTVPAGKTFYLFGIQSGNTGAGAGNVYENDGTTVVAYMQNTTTNNTTLMSYIPIAVYTENQNVKINFTTSMNICIYGVLQ